MSQIDKILRISQNFEKTREQRYGATGRGLHEKVTSVESKLPKDVVRNLRKIATIRNKAVHEDVDIAARELKTVQQAAKEASIGMGLRRRGIGILGWLVILAAVAGTAWWFFGR